MHNNITLGTLDKLIIHFVGNKINGDGVRFSDNLTNFEDIGDYLKLLFVNNLKSEEFFQFFFLPNLELNPVYQFTKTIFQNNDAFIEQSQNLGRYLYDKSIHHQIKSGELCIVYYKDCQLNNKAVDCIGLFKSENKETVLKIDSIKDGFSLMDIKGISTHKLDKGCLIFNTNEFEGFLVSMIDNTNKNIEAQYWKDGFLSIQSQKNEFHHTNQFLGMAKQFVTKQLPEEFELTKTDQIDLLNRSVEYFKTHGSFDKREFEDEVFKDSGIIKSFQDFDSNYRLENELEFTDNFDISPQAVKKQARVFKSVLKLDKNFHIYIHGNRDLIEQGVDENGRKFYKIFYHEER